MTAANRSRAAARLPDRRVRDDSTFPPEILLLGARQSHEVKCLALGHAVRSIVYGIRATRQEGRLMRSVRDAYYNLITSLSELAVPPGVGDFQLVDRKVVDAMRNIKDVYPFMRMMTFECGFHSVGVPYTWLARKRGISKNRLINLFDQGMNGIVTFTKAPLRIALFSGVVLSIFSVLFAAFNIIHGLVSDEPLAPRGILTIIVGLFFFGGMQIFFLGMIGEYILQIYAHVRNSPMVVERERVNFPDTLSH